MEGLGLNWLYIDNRLWRIVNGERYEDVFMEVDVLLTDKGGHWLVLLEKHRPLMEDGSLMMLTFRCL